MSTQKIKIDNQISNLNMLQNIHIENYKAFEAADIPIKPITVLLGANSVGKSSIIQLLLLLQQTGKEGIKSYKSALKLYGGYVNLGDSINLLRNRDTSKSINLNFEIRSKYLKERLGTNLIEEFKDSFSNVVRYIPLKAFKELRNKEINSKEDLEQFINVYIDLFSNKNAKDDFITEVKWFLEQRSIFKFGEINKFTKGSIIKAYTFLLQLSKLIKTETFNISVSISYNENRFFVNELCLSHKDKEIIKLENNEIFSLSSDLIELTNKDKNDIEEHFNPYNTIFSGFSFFNLEKPTTALTTIIVNIFDIALTELKSEFSEEKINYVSPLRAHPKRYYMLDKDKINLTLDTLDGDAIADVLKDNSNIKDKVNGWLKEFNLAVDVEEFKEVIHHLKVKQNNLNLDITDVGFGISQVLPVIIQGFLSQKNSTTIIEQPEIHLHPKIQADLADLFIDIIKNNGKEKKIVIETHSEYLLKRLRRRISEGVISANDVSICLFNPSSNEKPAFIDILQVEEKGHFNWPIEFYGGELLKDTTEFLKNQ